MIEVGHSPASLKPEITIFDPQGKHNRDIDGATERLVKGATWKQQRIVVILPAANKVSTTAALSWWNLIFAPNQPSIKAVATGMEVGSAYSECIEYILAHPEFSKWEYILTLEHDNVVPHDGILNLIGRMDAHPEFDCISGLYYTKGEGGCAQIWGDINDPIPNFRPQPPRAGELIECYGTGMGFALWRIPMFKDKNIARPLFQTKSSAEGIGTQDLAFWQEARKWGYRCAVDCNVRVGHIDSDGFIW